MLIPRKGVIELRRAIETREAPSAIGVYQGNFVLKADDVSLSVKLIDGQFPPYDQVIPKDNDRAVVVSRLAFLDALRRVAIMSSDKTQGVRIGLEKGKLRIESDNPDLGAAKEEIDVPYKGPALQIGFNARYFMELLGGDRDRRRSASSSRASSTRAWCGRPTGATTSGWSCR